MSRKKIQVLIRQSPLLTWVLLGFLMSYISFFVYPIFFSSQAMQFFKYLPAYDHIGSDLKLAIHFSELWFVFKQSPYEGINLYSPLSILLFAPLLIVKFSWAYKIVTLFNVFCYVMITFVFPLRISKERRVLPLLMLIFITGLFSYGFQFELERGQSNVIAIFICFLAIWIYHYHNRYRYLAYILFIISVQLKIYPFIFIVMLISNWQDWRNNVKKLLTLATVNFALFFVLGPNVFFDFLKSIIDNSLNASVWAGNHSIHSFVTFFSNILYGNGWVWVKQYSGLIQIVLLAIILGCIFLIMLQAYRQKQKDINPFLLLACTIGACLIPSISHDYKLSILGAPVAILFSNIRIWKKTNSPRLNIIYIVLLLIFSAAYSSTLFSFTNKHVILSNNFPALVMMLLYITFLSLVSVNTNLEGKLSEPSETVLQRVEANDAVLASETVAEPNRHLAKNTLIKIYRRIKND